MRVESYRSPDDQLELAVERDESGDLTIHFVGYAWHTHGDILASLNGGTPESATRDFVRRILGDELAIAVCYRASQVADVFPAENPEEEIVDFTKYAESGESVRFRLWGGSQVLPKREE